MDGTMNIEAQKLRFIVAMIRYEGAHRMMLLFACFWWFPKFRRFHRAAITKSFLTAWAQMHKEIQKFLSKILLRAQLDHLDNIICSSLAMQQIITQRQLRCKKVSLEKSTVLPSWSPQEWHYRFGCWCIWPMSKFRWFRPPSDNAAQFQTDQKRHSEASRSALANQCHSPPSICLGWN